MANETTYLIRGAAWLAESLGQEAEAFADFSTAHFGIELPDAVLQKQEVKDALRRSGAAATKVRDAGTKLEKISASASEQDILLAFLELGTSLAELFAALDGLSGAVSRNMGGSVPDAARRFAEEMPKRLADHAIASGIIDRLPKLAFVLKLLGLLKWERAPEDATKGIAHAYVHKSLQLDRIGDLISNPARHFQDTIGWGANEFNPLGFFQLVSDFYPPEADIQTGVESGEPFIETTHLRVVRDRSASGKPPGLKITLRAEVRADLEKRVAVADQWDVGISSDVHLTGSIPATLRPPLDFRLSPDPGVTLSGDFRGFFERNEKKRPFDIVGGTGLVSLSAQNLSAGLGLKASWDVGTKQATIDPLLFARLDKLTLKLGSDDADSFVGSLLSAAEVEGTFDLGLEWAMSTGLKVAASGGIEIALPVHRQLGPIELSTIYLALRIQNDGTLSLEASTALVGSLGPLSASVDRIGAGLDLKFAKDAGAKFGGFDADLHFKPPNGIGVAVDAGVVKGGGYLYIDVDRGEYAGVLELTIAEFVSVKAIGLITTRLPDGSSGFTLLIIITAEFGSGIQLGFGFTLLGVGGLLGVNRTARLERLVEGVRTGAVDRIMFPQNVVANAPQIISDLRSFFPAEVGTFLIGPMARIGWGTPTLISLSLGIIIEIPPGNIIILGVLKVVLPTQEAAVLKLQVNFIGAIEFDKKRVWFFAALFDSRILFLTIEGEMGLLVAFGDDANFVVSVGGFHPLFQPPPLPFPAPKRVAISLIDTDYARIRIEGYFAVTSNTVQFGAAVELYFGLAIIEIKGHLAFDALFQFSPFYFIITLSASFSLNVFGASLLSVNVNGSLEGPTPWHIRGTATVHILFFDISADIDVQWGEEKHDVLPPIEVLPLLKAELDKKENWRALLPASNNLLVSLRPLPEDSPLVLHPLGVLRIAQRAVPLELTLDKVGNKKPSDVNRLTLLVLEGGLERKSAAWEQFAPAQYQDFEDSDKLSRPAYAPAPAGLELSAAGTEMSSPRMARRAIRYEEIVVDGKARTRAAGGGYPERLFNHFLGGSAITRSELSMSARSKLDPFAEKMATGPALYTVAFQSNNRPFAADPFPSEASAREYLARQAERDPNLAEELHVIPTVEKAA